MRQTNPTQIFIFFQKNIFHLFLFRYLCLHRLNHKIYNNMKDRNILDIDHLLWCISTHDDETAYRSLFEYYYSPLCLYAKRYIEDKSVREDIVQDVFFFIWDKRKTINTDISGRNYLITCVKNLSLNYLRKQGYKQAYQNKIIETPPIYSNNLDDMYTWNELQELLTRTLDKLPTEYRLAFEMSRMENKNMNEVAENMGVSVRTVERYRNKALEILKEELKDYLPLLYVCILME